MSVYHNIRNGALASAIAVAVVAGLSASAQAEKMRTEGPPPSSALMQLGQFDAPRDEFFLNSDENVELIRFTSKRDNKICVPRVNHDRIDAAKKEIPLKVMWDGNNAIIQPGQCLSFDAKSVKVKPATALPEGVELLGTIHTNK